jgi:hypothetical protein
MTCCSTASSASSSAAVWAGSVLRAGLLPRAHPLQILAVWRGGMSFHGGFLGVLVAMGCTPGRSAAPGSKSPTSSHRWCRSVSPPGASATSSTASCGAAWRIRRCPGQWFFPGWTTCRATPRSSIRPASKGCCCSFSCGCIRAASDRAVPFRESFSSATAACAGLAEYFRSPDAGYLRPFIHRQHGAVVVAADDCCGHFCRRRVSPTHLSRSAPTARRRRKMAEGMVVRGLRRVRTLLAEGRSALELEGKHLVAFAICCMNAPAASAVKSRPAARRPSGRNLPAAQRRGSRHLPEHHRQ